MSRHQEFFHGTTAHLFPGDVIEPGRRSNYVQISDPRYAYATTNRQDAEHYAEVAYHASDTGSPRVYQVEPLGRHSKDPLVDRQGNSRGNFDSDRRSKDGWEVVGEMELPEHLRGME